MKAFLLAAGLGTRLRPITDIVPKCLVPVCGKPLMAIWLELLGRHGVHEVLINTHYLAAQVGRFLERWCGPPQVRIVHEGVLLGSAGTIARNWDFVAAEDDFLVCYADNLTDIDLSRLLLSHRRQPCLGTMALFRSDRPRECGIAELDGRGVLVGFEEKPRAPRTDYANAGVYVFSPAIRSLLPASAPSDIAKDLVPACLGRLRGWLWDGLLIDIGSPEAYERAQAGWASKHGLTAGAYVERGRGNDPQAFAPETAKGIHS